MAKAQTALEYLTGSSAPGTGVQYDENDIDKLTRTILGEAANQGAEGQAAVAHIIVNRFKKGGYGKSIAGVTQAADKNGYHAFSAWNSKDKSGNDNVNLPASSKQYIAARQIAEQVLSGGLAPPPALVGAVNYYAPSGMTGKNGTKKGEPDWARSMVYTGSIGGHRFYAPKGSGATAAHDQYRGSIDKPIQDALRYNGFNPGKSDGVFGPKTDAAVRAFQSTHGLKVDGIVGPKTLAALQSATTSRLPPSASPAPARPAEVVAPPNTAQIGSAFQPERNGWGSNGFTYSWMNKGATPTPSYAGQDRAPPGLPTANQNGFKFTPANDTGRWGWQSPFMSTGASMLASQGKPAFSLNGYIDTATKLAPKRTAVATSVDVPKVKVKKPYVRASSGRSQASVGETFDSVWNEAKG